MRKIIVFLSNLINFVFTPVIVLIKGIPILNIGFFLILCNIVCKITKFSFLECLLASTISYCLILVIVANFIAHFAYNKDYKNWLKE